MKFKTYLKRLEKKKIISKKPHPILPFILAIISFVLSKVTPESIFQKSLLYLTVFALIFAIIHLIVSTLLKK